MAVEKPIVVAIEIGTTQIGFAYINRTRLSDLLHNDMGKYGKEYAAESEPTRVLLDPFGNCNYFGSEADIKYRALGENTQGWTLLMDFMFLHSNKVLSRESTLTDQHGKTHQALPILTSLLKHFQQKVLNKLADKTESSIQYVITAPGLLNLSAKELLMEAAKDAHIHGDRLTIIMEKYAVVLWHWSVNEEWKQIMETHGKKLIVLETEGENIDVGTFDTMFNGQFKTVDTLSTCHKGGAFVDAQFIKFIATQTVSESFDEFSKTNKSEINELLQTFRVHKSNFNGTKPMVIKCPYEIYGVLNKSKQADFKLSRNGQIIIGETFLKEWFKVPLQGIKCSLQEIYTQTGKTKMVIMMDGFTRCPYVKKMISHKYAERAHLMFPIQSNTDVLHGAMISVMSNNERSAYKPLVLAAFDFGTTYSGYAYSLVQTQRKIQIPTWTARDPSATLISYKAPTSVLLQPGDKFHSFGFDAEHHFSSLESPEGWRLFRRFKMILHNETTLSRKTTIVDTTGKSHPAMPIFTMAIKKLHEELIEKVQISMPHILETMFAYVITVPAIWDDKAKQFMREAAIYAGIQGSRLKLVLEPEVAPLWYMADPDNQSANLQNLGNKFMVVDLGGGTADIAVIEQLSKESIRIIQKPSGGPWGGVSVDENFVAFLEKVFGKDRFSSFRKNEMVDFFDVMQCFETKKRSQSDTFVLRIPRSLTDIPIRTDMSGNISLNKDKLMIQLPVVMSWFEKPVKALTNHIKTQLKTPELRDVNTILLVGGFAQNKYIHQEIEKEIPDIRLIVPEDAGLAVLKGAVLFGHNPTMVTSRVLSYTYGISLYHTFDHSKHPVEKKVLVNSKWLACDCFEIFVRNNDEVSVNHKVTHSASPLGLRPVVKVYRTKSPEPEYTTDPGCELLAKIFTECRPDKPLKDQFFKVSFMFGNTEMQVTVKDATTGKEEQITLDCI